MAAKTDADKNFKPTSSLVWFQIPADDAGARQKILPRAVWAEDQSVSQFAPWRT
jgi:hypothetical protein